MSNPIEIYLIPHKDKKKKQVKMTEIFTNVKNNKTVKIYPLGIKNRVIISKKKIIPRTKIIYLYSIMYFMKLYSLVIYCKPLYTFRYDR